MDNKFEGFPPVYLLSLESHENRQEEIFRQLKKYGIDRCEVVLGYDAKKEDFRDNHPLVDGRFFDKLSSVDIACSIGHLKMIKHWYDTSSSEYAIFLEDDVDLEISDYWNFGWNDVMKILPNDWSAMQFSIIREDISDDDFKINVLKYNTWSAAAYMIKRDYARHLIWSYIENGKYHIRLLQEPQISIPYVEDIIFFPSMTYGGYRGGYAFPIFGEKLNSVSTFFPQGSTNPIKKINSISSEKIHNWWIENGTKTAIDYFKLK